MAAHRAKRKWHKAFREQFLLFDQEDYVLWTQKIDQGWLLTAIFYTACGRYACWRIKNNQAPQAVSEMGLLP